MSLSISAANAGLTSSLINQRQRQTQLTSQALERLSTGKRINSASDDPAGLIAAERTRGELTDLKATYKNYQRSDLSLRQQESRLSAVHSQLHDLRGTIVEATGSQRSGSEKRALQQTIDATLESVDRISENGSSPNLAELGSAGAANVVNGDGELAAQIVDGASQSVGLQRAAVASQQRQNEIYQRITEDQIVITTETLSQIEDADFATEAANLAGSQVLTRAANAALAYSQQTYANQIGSLLDEIDTPGRSNRN